MNPLISMGFNPPNPVAAYTGGVEAKGIVDDRQNQNALRGYIQQNGAGIMSGDQNALAGLGGMGPQGLEMAMGVQNQQLGQEATRQGMAIDRERLGMARQQIAAATRQAALEMADEDRARITAQVERSGKQLAAAIASGNPDAIRAVMPNLPAEARQALEAGENPQSVLFAMDVAGETLMSLQPGIAKPQTSIAKLESDRANGLITEEQYALGLEALKPSGMAIEMGADGGFSLRQGSGVTSGARLTETQGKDNLYSTMMAGAMPDIDAYEKALTGIGDSVAGSLPMDLGKFVQTDEYKIGKSAATEFTIAVLRKQSGAAIMPYEQAEMEELYIPSPGDGDGLLARKKQARARALAAVESGMSPEQILMQERALVRSGGTSPSDPDGGANTSTSIKPWMTTKPPSEWTPEEQAEVRRVLGK